jgi:2-polyprenyl-3-methyl-5-hydroxy-6-metoxy-1,4-benzoquinol methylase
LAREPGSARRPIRILDLASGGGDTPIALARRAARAGLQVEIDGCDINPQAVRYAQEQANTLGVRARFFVLDALNESIPVDYDILSCSLFLHHLDEADAISLMRRMAAAARRFVLIDDLIPEPVGLCPALVGTHLLTGSRIVHVDGPLSC